MAPGTERYVYDPGNLRVWKEGLVYFYGIEGNLLATYGDGSNTDYNVYFGEKLIWQEAAAGLAAHPVNSDRLDSNVKHFPYGEESTTTTQNRTKFATYYRDSSTALDYARNRYYARTIGRFTSPDPLGAGSRGSNPQSWNRYSYGGNDPVNNSDPTGLSTAEEDRLAELQYIGLIPYGVSVWDVNPEILWAPWTGSYNQYFSEMQYLGGVANVWNMSVEQMFGGDVGGGVYVDGGGPAGWGQAENPCHERNLRYLSSLGLGVAGSEFGDNGGIRWMVTREQASALEAVLAGDPEEFESGSGWFWGGQHSGDLGGTPTSDNRSVTSRAQPDRERSAQIVVGPELLDDMGNRYVYVYADTDRYNPKQGVGGFLGHTVVEVIPGAVGLNTSCNGT